jgi:DNA-binding response OmpR family regulator
MPNGAILFVSRELPDDQTRRLLEDRGFQASGVEESVAISQSVGQTGFAAVVVDLRVGPEALRFIRSARDNELTKLLPLLAVGEWGSGEPTLALSFGADAYEPTPIDAGRLLAAVEGLVSPGIARTAKASTNGDSDE